MQPIHFQQLKLTNLFFSHSNGVILIITKLAYNLFVFKFKSILLWGEK